MAGVLNHLAPHVGHGVQALVEFSAREAATPPAGQAVVAGVHHQRGRLDGGVQRQHLVDAEQLRVDDAVRRVAQDGAARAAVGLGALFRPLARQPVGFGLRQAVVGLHQARGHAGQVVVAAQRHLAAVQGLDLVQPLGVARRCLRGSRGGHAVALQVDQAADACRPRAGEHHGDVAAHAVADQIDRALARVMVEQEFQIAQVVGKAVVVARRPGGLAEAAPVGRDDEAAREEGRRQRVDHELV